jgi:putative flippase GtrA
VVGLPFQVALVLGFTTALVTHFSLQRFFVWVHHDDFALPLGTQAGRYLTISLTQYGVTAATTATLPDALGVAPEIVYLVVTALVTIVNFLLFRTHVFHPEPAGAVAQAGAPAGAPGPPGETRC